MVGEYNVTDPEFIKKKKNPSGSDNKVVKCLSKPN